MRFAFSPVFLMICWSLVGQNIEQSTAYRTSRQVADQLVTIEHFTTQDGLADPMVSAIYQTNDGLLWLGTKGGLARFDGQSFQNYAAPDVNLSSNEVTILKEDQDGKLWLFSAVRVQQYDQVKTIDIFDPKTEEAHSFSAYFGDQAPFQPADIRSVTSLVDRSLVFFTYDGRYIRYTAEQNFTSYPFLSGREFRTFDDPRFLSTSWGLTLRDSLNAYYTASLVEVDSTGQILREFPTQDTFNHVQWGGTDTNGGVLYADFNHKREWFDGLYYVDDDRSDCTPWLTSILPAAYLARAQTDWLDFKLHPTKDILFSIFDEKMYAYHIQDEWVYDLTADFPGLYNVFFFYYDRQGRLWLGSDHGFYCVTISKNYLEYFFDDYPRQLLGFNVRRIFPGETEILAAAHYGGLMQWQEGLETNTSVEQLKRNVSSTLAGEVAEDPQEMLFEVMVDRRGRKWLGMDRILEEQTDGSWLRHGYDSGVEGLCDHVNLIFEDKSGQIWYSCDQTLGYLTPAGYMLDLDIPEQFKALRSASIRQWYSDVPGEIWLVTNAGLFHVDTRSRKVFAYYSNTATEGNMLPIRSVYHMCPAVEGGFWLATEGEGLVLWHPITGIMKQYTRLDGLPSNTIYSVYSDKKGYLWASSPAGLLRVDPDRNFCYILRTEDGLLGDTFNPLAHAQGADGKLYFGNQNGVVCIDSKEFSITAPTTPTPVLLERVEVLAGDTSVMKDYTATVRESGSLALYSSDRLFRISFVFPTLESTDFQGYAWTIDGLGMDWNYQQEPSIQLGNLPYGAYNLRVRGQDRHGRWSAEELELAIVSHKPFYLQAWFLSLVVAFLLAGIWWYNRLRVHQFQARQEKLEATVAERTLQIMTDKAVIEKQAQELQSLEQLKSRFFANVSHELRTPLSLLLGPVNRLLKRTNWEEKDRQLLNLIRRNGQQLLKLVNEILDLSKLETGRLEVQEEMTPLKKFISPLLTQFYAYGIEHQLKIELAYLPKDELYVMLDRVKVEKVLNNYLSNASKFTEPGGEIILLLVDLGDKLRFEVRDTGNGIHPDDLPHVFDRFYQSKQIDAPAQGGTGIGLSLCQELAAVMGGKVWAESRLGEGSTFYFEIPKNEVPRPEGTDSPSEPTILSEASLTEVLSVPGRERQPSSPAGTDKPRVLLVEDNADLRTYLAGLLEDYYEVRTASNGKGAIDQLLENPAPQLILSDLMMPVVDGFQLLNWVKEHDAFRHIPFIMLTARRDIGVKLRALRIGVDDYLTKPFHEEELLARAGNLLENLERRLEVTSGLKTEGLAAKSHPVLSAADNEWLASVETVLESQLADASLKLDYAANLLNISTRQLRRRLKQCSGMSPQKYLREMRMQKAREYLNEGRYATVKEAAYAVGFLDARYFSKIFEKRFGVLPSIYANG